MTIKGPDTSSMDYKYGIFTRVKDSGSKSWSDDQVKWWCDENNVYYEDEDDREDLIQRIKDAGYKQMLEFLRIIGMALGLSIAMVGGFWFGFKVMDIATGGKISRILGSK